MNWIGIGLILCAIALLMLGYLAGLEECVCY